MKDENIRRKIAKHFGFKAKHFKRIADGTGYKPWVEKAKKEVENEKAVITNNKAKII